jgi:hypothetical protein
MHFSFLLWTSHASSSSPSYIVYPNSLTKGSNARNSHCYKQNIDTYT